MVEEDGGLGEELFALIRFAHRYQVEALLTRLVAVPRPSQVSYPSLPREVEVAESRLSSGAVTDTLALARELSLKWLQDRCVDFLHDHYDQGQPQLDALISEIVQEQREEPN